MFGGVFNYFGGQQQASPPQPQPAAGGFRGFGGFGAAAATPAPAPAAAVPSGGIFSGGFGGLRSGGSPGATAGRPAYTPAPAPAAPAPAPFARPRFGHSPQQQGYPQRQQAAPAPEPAASAAAVFSGFGGFGGWDKQQQQQPQQQQQQQPYYAQEAPAAPASRVGGYLAPGRAGGGGGGGDGGTQRAAYMAQRQPRRTSPGATAGGAPQQRLQQQPEQMQQMGYAPPQQQQQQRRSSLPNRTGPSHAQFQTQSRAQSQSQAQSHSQWQSQDDEAMGDSGDLGAGFDQEYDAAEPSAPYTRPAATAAAAAPGPRRVPPPPAAAPPRQSAPPAYQRIRADALAARTAGGAGADSFGGSMDGAGGGGGGGGAEESRTSLHVRDLPADATEPMLRSHFARFGEVLGIDINPVKRFAVVVFADPSAARMAKGRGKTLVTPSARRGAPLRLFWYQPGGAAAQPPVAAVRPRSTPPEAPAPAAPGTASERRVRFDRHAAAASSGSDNEGASSSAGGAAAAARRPVRVQQRVPVEPPSSSRFPRRDDRFEGDDDDMRGAPPPPARAPARAPAAATADGRRAPVSSLPGASKPPLTLRRKGEGAAAVAPAPPPVRAPAPRVGRRQAKQQEEEEAEEPEADSEETAEEEEEEYEGESDEEEEEGDEEEEEEEEEDQGETEAGDEDDQQLGEGEGLEDEPAPAPEPAPRAAAKGGLKRTVSGRLMDHAALEDLDFSSSAAPAPAPAPRPRASTQEPAPAPAAPLTAEQRRARARERLAQAKADVAADRAGTPQYAPAVVAAAPGRFVPVVTGKPRPPPEPVMDEAGEVGTVDDGKIGTSELTDKRYERSAAGDERTDFTDIRPPHVLVKAVTHVIHSILDADRPGHNTAGMEDTSIRFIQRFTVDRMRAVLTDFLVQNYRECCRNDAWVIECLERCVRAHVLLLYDASEDPDYLRVENKLLEEQLGKHLKLLFELYDDARARSIAGVAELQSPHEAEFRAYYLLLMIADKDSQKGLLAMLAAVPQHVRRSSVLRHAVDCWKAYTTENASALLALIGDADRTPFLSACLLSRVLPRIRQAALKSINASYGTARATARRGVRGGMSSDEEGGAAASPWTEPWATRTGSAAEALASLPARYLLPDELARMLRLRDAEDAVELCNTHGITVEYRPGSAAAAEAERAAAEAAAAASKRRVAGDTLPPLRHPVRRVPPSADGLPDVLIVTRGSTFIELNSEGVVNQRRPEPWLIPDPRNTPRPDGKRGRLLRAELVDVPGATWAADADAAAFAPVGSASGLFPRGSRYATELRPGARGSLSPAQAEAAKRGAGNGAAVQLRAPPPPLARRVASSAATDASAAESAATGGAGVQSSGGDTGASAGGAAATATGVSSPATKTVKGKGKGKAGAEAAAPAAVPAAPGAPTETATLAQLWGKQSTATTAAPSAPEPRIQVSITQAPPLPSFGATQWPSTSSTTTTTTAAPGIEASPGRRRRSGGTAAADSGHGVPLPHRVPSSTGDFGLPLRMGSTQGITEPLFGMSLDMTGGAGAGAGAGGADTMGTGVGAGGLTADGGRAGSAAHAAAAVPAAAPAPPTAASDLAALAARVNAAADAAEDAEAALQALRRRPGPYPFPPRSAAAGVVVNSPAAPEAPSHLSGDNRYSSPLPPPSFSASSAGRRASLVSVSSLSAASVSSVHDPQGGHAFFIRPSSPAADAAAASFAFRKAVEAHVRTAGRLATELDEASAAISDAAAIAASNPNAPAIQQLNVELEQSLETWEAESAALSDAAIVLRDALDAAAAARDQQARLTAAGAAVKAKLRSNLMRRCFAAWRDDVRSSVRLRARTLQTLAGVTGGGTATTTLASPQGRTFSLRKRKATVASVGGEVATRSGEAAQYRLQRLYAAAEENARAVGQQSWRPFDLPALLAPHLSLRPATPASAAPRMLTFALLMMNAARAGQAGELLCAKWLAAKLSHGDRLQRQAQVHVQAPADADADMADASRAAGDGRTVLSRYIAEIEADELLPTRPAYSRTAVPPAAPPAAPAPAASAAATAGHAVASAAGPSPRGPSRSTSGSRSHRDQNRNSNGGAMEEDSQPAAAATIPNAPQMIAVAPKRVGILVKAVTPADVADRHAAAAAVAGSQAVLLPVHVHLRVRQAAAAAAAVTVDAACDIPAARAQLGSLLLPLVPDGCCPIAVLLVLHIDSDGSSHTSAAPAEQWQQVATVEAGAATAAGSAGGLAYDTVSALKTLVAAELRLSDLPVPVVPATSVSVANPFLLLHTLQTAMKGSADTQPQAQAPAPASTTSSRKRGRAFSEEDGLDAASVTAAAAAAAASNYRDVRSSAAAAQALAVLTHISCAPSDLTPAKPSLRYMLHRLSRDQLGPCGMSSLVLKSLLRWAAAASDPQPRLISPPLSQLLNTVLSSTLQHADSKVELLPMPAWRAYAQSCDALLSCLCGGEDRASSDSGTASSGSSGSGLLRQSAVRYPPPDLVQAGESSGSSSTGTGTPAADEACAHVTACVRASMLPLTLPPAVSAALHERLNEVAPAAGQLWASVAATYALAQALLSAHCEADAAASTASVGPGLAVDAASLSATGAAQARAALAASYPFTPYCVLTVPKAYASLARSVDRLLRAWTRATFSALSAFSNTSTGSSDDKATAAAAVAVQLPPLPWTPMLRLLAQDRITAACESVESGTSATVTSTPLILRAALRAAVEAPAAAAAATRPGTPPVAAFDEQLAASLVRVNIEVASQEVRSALGLMLPARTAAAAATTQSRGGTAASAGIPFGNADQITAEQALASEEEEAARLLQAVVAEMAAEKAAAAAWESELAAMCGEGLDYGYDQQYEDGSMGDAELAAAVGVRAGADAAWQLTATTGAKRARVEGQGQHGPSHQLQAALNAASASVGIAHLVAPFSAVEDEYARVAAITALPAWEEGLSGVDSTSSSGGAGAGGEDPDAQLWRELEAAQRMLASAKESSARLDTALLLASVD